MNEREIFEAALAIADPGDRACYLDQACEGDPPLREHLRGLLEAHDKLGGFLQRPLPIAGDVTSAQSPSPKVGAIIAGRYKLLEQIGEGGMGSVWVAEQSEPVRRRVALKLIKPGMDTRQVLSRFEAERQALALMDHPNIAKVFDGGMTDEGRPYFVMEYVKGLPITQYCDDTRLTVADRLALFTQVCQAVQHAHQKGIIHRDLKPSNILVCLYDGQPVPKVIDFGLAKAMYQSLTEHTLYTAHGLMVGTPLYMSPEQAEFNNLDIDTRSDIYSLGVILYELLTGTTPLERQQFKDAAWQEMLRLIKEQEPPRPSVRLSGSVSLPSLAAQRSLDPARLTKTVRGELDWIVMKALEKDRGRRYETANGLAADVQRYLSDEPVQACPPSAGYRLRKFVRRNKRALATATLAGVLLLVALGTVAGSIGWLVRDQEARRTKLAGQLELILDEVNKQEAVQKWPEALSAAQRAEALIAGGGGDAALEKQVRNVLADLTLVERLEDLWLELAGENKNHTYEWSDRAYAAAFREYGLDLDRCTAEEAAQRVAPRPVAMALASRLDHWATCRRALGDDSGSVKLLTVAGQIDPDPWRHKVRDAMARKDLKALDEMADAADLASQQAPTLYLLGTMLHRAGKQDRAIEVFRQAQRSHPDDYWINAMLGRYLSFQGRAHALESVGFLRVVVALRPHKANIHEALGFSLHQAGKLDEAIACYKKAIELDPKNPWAHGNLGNALRGQKKLDEAIACYKKAIELDPKNAGAHNNLGLALREQKKLDEAIVSLKKAIELDPKYAGAPNNLGLVLRDQKKLDEAVVNFKKAIELDPKNAGAHNNLGVALLEQNKLDEAAACYRQVIELDPNNARAHNQLGVILRAQKQVDEAIASFRTAIELDPNYAAAHHNLGLSLRDHKQLDEAIASFRKTIELDPNSALAYHDLGLAINRQNKLDEAIACYRKAIELAPKFAPAQYNLGRALAAQQKLDEAIACFRKAIELDPKLTLAYYSLGAALAAQKKLDEAVACYRTLVERVPESPRAHGTLGVALAAQNKPDEAIVCYRRAIEVNPKYAMAHNNLAWLRATCSDPKLRDPADAVAAAKKAVELDPNNPLFPSTLGAAYYRSGEWNAAITAFEKSMELRKGGDGHEWFFLAMAHWQLGDKDKAHEWYVRAAEWMDKNQEGNEELRRFRAEAAGLLGIAETAGAKSL